MKSSSKILRKILPLFAIGIMIVIVILWGLMVQWEEQKNTPLDLESLQLATGPSPAPSPEEKKEKSEVIYSAYSRHPFDPAFKLEIVRNPFFYSDKDSAEHPPRYEVFLTDIKNSARKRIYYSYDELKEADFIRDDDAIYLTGACPGYCIYSKVIGMTDEQANIKTHWEAIPKPDVAYHDKVSPDGRYILSERMEGTDPNRYRRMYVTDLQTNQRWRIYSGDKRLMDGYWLSDNKIYLYYRCSSDCVVIKTVTLDDQTFVSDFPGEEISKKNGWEIRVSTDMNFDPEKCIKSDSTVSDSEWTCYF